MKKLSKNGIYAVLIVILTFLIVIPIITVLIEAVVVDDRLNFANAVHTICQKENLNTIINSLLLGILVVITSTVIATPLAFILVRTKYAEKKWLDIVLMIPFSNCFLRPERCQNNFFH